MQNFEYKTPITYTFNYKFITEMATKESWNIIGSVLKACVWKYLQFYDTFD